MPDNKRTAGSSDFAAVGYWSAGALAANQDLYLLTGPDSFMTNTDQSALDFKSVTFDQQQGDATATMGNGAGGPVKFTCDQASTGIVRVANKMALALMGGTTWNRLEFYPANQNYRLMLAGITTMNDCWVDGGQLTVGDTAALPATNPIRIFDGDHVIEAHATNVPAAIEVYGGRVVVKRDFTALYIYGAAQVTLDLPAGTTGGIVNLMAAKDVGRLLHVAGDLGVVNLLSGVYDKSRLSANAATGTMHAWPGCTEVLERGYAKVTPSSRTDYMRGPRKV